MTQEDSSRSIKSFLSIKGIRKCKIESWISLAKSLQSS